MSETLEQQAEEREALQSIYEGDDAFKEINATTFQYKYGEDMNYRSFLVEIKWGEDYPNVLPTINMDTFYNRNMYVEENTMFILLLISQIITHALYL